MWGLEGLTGPGRQVTGVGWAAEPVDRKQGTEKTTVPVLAFLNEQCLLCIKTHLFLVGGWGWVGNNPADETALFPTPAELLGFLP